MWTWKEQDPESKQVRNICCELCGIDMSSGFDIEEETGIYHPDINGTCLVPYMIINGKRYKRSTAFLTDDAFDEEIEERVIYSSNGKESKKEIIDHRKLRCMECDTMLERCHDCGIVYGGFHHVGCDDEPCPRCGDQFFVCTCESKRFPSIKECSEFTKMGLQ